jgi:hypothetical protein
MNDWQNFFVAEVGASAALLGLLFVSISINLTKILSFRSLPNRAFGALLALLAVLVVSSILLTPGQPMPFAGAEVFVIGLGVWAAITFFDVHLWRSTAKDAEHRPRLKVLSVVDQVTTLLYVVAGVVIFKYGVVGVYWLVPAFLFSFAKATMDAWVLLVEINR